MTGYSRNAGVHQGRLDEGVNLLEKPISQAKLALAVGPGFTALNGIRRGP
jgi:hypothetical protein